MEEIRPIYSKNVIEFVTVVAETCLLMENASALTKTDFISKATKLLPLLYVKTTLVEDLKDGQEGYMERFVQEEDYLFVKNQVEILLGADDSYLEVFDPNMPYSDTPIAAFISENLADIYQELKDFTANFQLGEEDIMTAALYECLDAFVEHWGQKLLNALRALHAVRYGNSQNEELDAGFDSTEYRKLDRQSFLKFQSDDED